MKMMMMMMMMMMNDEKKNDVKNDDDVKKKKKKKKKNDVKKNEKEIFDGWACLRESRWEWGRQQGRAGIPRRWRRARGRSQNQR